MLKVVSTLGAMLFIATAAQADVEIGAQKIVTGTEIKVIGPVPGLDLQMIIDKIMDAGPTKPYLVKLGPGEYTLNANLAMKQYVSIVGSGDGVTILKGAIGDAGGFGPDSAIVAGAADTVLTDLRVVNTGSSSYSSGIVNLGVSPRIQNVSAFVSGATNGNVGIFNAGASPTMINVLAEVSGTVSEENYAIFNNSASPLILNVQARSTGEPTNFGVYNLSSSPVLSNVEATAIGGTNCTGVANVGTSSPTMNNVTATAAGTIDSKAVFNSGDSSPTMTSVAATALGAGSNWGVFNFDSSATPRIARSILSGSTGALHFGGSTDTRVTDTQLIGGIDADPDALSTQCRNTYDVDLADVAC